MQLPLLKVESEWEAPDLDSLPSWADAKRVGFDLETCDPDLKKLGPGVRREGCFIAGFSFCLDGGTPYYVPTHHLGGGNVDSAVAFQYLRDQMKNFRGELIGANLSYDLDWAMEYGVDFSNVKRFSDIQIAAALISELHFTYSMQDIAERLGIEGKDETLLREAAFRYGVDPKGELWKLPAKYVGPYAEHDAKLPMQILQRQQMTIDVQDLNRVWKLESELLPVLVKMRRRGVRISLDRLTEIEEWAWAEEEKALEAVFQITGHRIAVGKVWTATLVANALAHQSIYAPTSATGKVSVKDPWLEQFAGNEVADHLRHARKVNKLRTTFVKGLREHEINGRIHCNLKQIVGDSGGARFGRMSCVKPNLQNQPAKGTEIGDLIRSAFLPDEGGQWLACDYAAQEPRMLIHFAAKLGLTGAREAAQRYHDDPSTDGHRMMASLVYNEPQELVTDKQRKNSKAIFLGLCYGMGSGKLAESLGLPVQVVEGGHKIAGPEAMKLLNRFHEAVPYVKELDQWCERQAKKYGTIRTLLGRVCHFPLDDDGKYDWTRTALNRLIQGSSADQTKQAMIDADRAGLPIALQIHDEIDMTTFSPEQTETLRRVMVDAVELRLPTVVDHEVGDNWAEAHEEETDMAGRMCERCPDAAQAVVQVIMLNGGGRSFACANCLKKAADKVLGDTVTAPTPSWLPGPQKGKPLAAKKGEGWF